MKAALALLLMACLSLPVQADGFITRLLNKPVPGGVAVVTLPEQDSAPRVRYQDQPVLVIREDNQRWIAIAGIPLTVKPGTEQLLLDNGQKLSFNVGNTLRLTPSISNVSNASWTNRSTPTRPSAHASPAI